MLLIRCFIVIVSCCILRLRVINYYLMLLIYKKYLRNKKCSRIVSKYITVLIALLCKKGNGTWTVKILCLELILRRCSCIRNAGMFAVRNVK